MSDREMPASLRKAGLVRLTHDIPVGFEVNFHADFCRIFKDEIERKGKPVQAANAHTEPVGSV